MSSEPEKYGVENHIYKDRDWLAEQLFEKDRYISDIAQECRVQVHRIQQSIYDNGLADNFEDLKQFIDEKEPEMSSDFVVNYEKRYQNEDWLRMMWEKRDRSIEEISEACDVSDKTINRWLIKNGLKEPDF